MRCATPATASPWPTSSPSAPLLRRRPSASLRVKAVSPTLVANHFPDRQRIGTRQLALLRCPCAAVLTEGHAPSVGFPWERWRRPLSHSGASGSLAEVSYAGPRHPTRHSQEPSGFERPAPVGEVPRGEDLSIADRGDLEVGRLDRCATQPALGPNGAGDKNLVTRLMNLLSLPLPVSPCVRHALPPATDPLAPAKDALLSRDVSLHSRLVLAFLGPECNKGLSVPPTEGLMGLVDDFFGVLLRHWAPGQYPRLFCRDRGTRRLLSHGSTSAPRAYIGLRQFAPLGSGASGALSWRQLLLAQPSGLQGFLRIEVSHRADDFAVLELSHPADGGLDLGSALFATRVQTPDRDDPFAKATDLRIVDTALSERLLLIAEPRADALMSAIHRRSPFQQRSHRRMPLHLGVEYREEGVDVLPIGSVRPALECLYVLLRHPPRSISPGVGRQRSPGDCRRWRPKVLLSHGCESKVSCWRDCRRSSPAVVSRAPGETLAYTRVA